MIYQALLHAQQLHRCLHDSFVFASNATYSELTK